MIAAAVFLGAPAAGEPGMPPISTFELPPSQGRGSVSALCLSGDGRMWVGSDRLFLFDGETFTAVPLPSGSAIQGIARDERGRPWIAGPGVIGWLEQDAQGDWHLHSLARELEAAGVSILGENWRLGLTADGMALATDQQVLRWEEGRFQTWDLTSKLRLAASWCGGRLWLYRHGAGILCLEKAGPRLVWSMADLPGAPVAWVLAADGRDPAVVGTGDGVFERIGGSWRRLPAVSAALAGKLPVGAVGLGGGRFAVGTYGGGVVLASTDGRVESVVDRAGGLPNDYDYTLCVDGRQNLWVGLEGVLARIGARGTTEIIDQRQGVGELPVARILEHGGRTFAVTSKALYDFGRDGSPGISRSPDFPGYLWDAASVGGNLFVGGFGGIWRRADPGSRWDHVLSGPSDVYCLDGMAGLPGGLMFLEGHALKALVPSAPGGWTIRDLGADVENAPLSEVAVGRDDVWVSTQAYGIFHFRWRGPAALELVRYFRLGLDLPGELTHATLTTLGGNLFALSPEGVWAYVPEDDRFEAVAALSGFVGVAAATDHDPAASFWIVKSRGAGAATAPVLVRVAGGGRPPTALAVRFLDVPGLEDAGRISTMSVIRAGAAPTLWIGGSRALLRIDPRRLAAIPAPARTLMRRVVKNGSELAALAPAGRVAFDPDTALLVFAFSSSAVVGGESPAYETRLLPVDADWSAPQRERLRTFTGLAPGAYEFQARTVDGLGRAGEPSAYPFAILAPWYERSSTIAGGALAAVLLALFVTRGRREARRRQTERLNRLVTERTRELALANAAKNEFLENISHEIRNPLNGVVGLAAMLKDAPLGPEERELTRSLGACAESLGRVFEDVLGLSKLEYGYVSVEQKPFALAPLLEEVTALFTLQARRQNNVLRLRWPEGFVDGFLGDEGKLKTIVANFVGNALKYAPGGPVEIDVETAPEGGPPDPRTRLSIRVSDRGPGIPGAEQKLLFRRFVRGSEAKASGASGTGLGLATCRALAELLGGSVALKSEPGQGAAFSVTVPLKRTRAPQRPAAQEPAARPDERALIVEDRDYNQIVLKGLARKLGYAADAAERSEEAMALAEQRRYAVVFLDWELPGLKGGDVARLLRRHPHTRDSVIVATTAHDNEEIREKCREAGMDGFAVKPYSVAGMRAMLAEARERRGGAPPAAPADGAAAEGDGPEVNLDTFKLFAAGDPERADEALKVYVETLDREVANLGRAVDARDRSAIGQATHHLRSHASLVGDKALNDAARILREKDAGAGPEELQAAYHRVVVRAEALKTILRAAKAKGPASR